MGGTTGLLLVGATASSATIQTKNIKEFRVTCIRLVHFANYFDVSNALFLSEMLESLPVVVTWYPRRLEQMQIRDTIKFSCVTELTSVGISTRTNAVAPTQYISRCCTEK